MSLRFTWCLLVSAWFVIGSGSCVMQRKLPYLQGEDYLMGKPTEVSNVRPTYLLHSGDVLNVRVQSVQPALSEIFNVPSTQTLTSGDPSTLYLTGYPLDENGFINLPTAGRVKMLGLSVDEAQALLQQKVSAYVRDANVLVKLVSFKITVLGEVRQPGRYFIYNTQATLLEGLGLAGDLTEFGNREKVKLIRQTAKGSEVTLLNLTDPKLLQSPYYYLMPNDALYVEPLKARAARGNANNLSVVFAGVSAIVLLLSYITLK
jgi:polysaccharide export outer membrane protein